MIERVAALDERRCLNSPQFSPTDHFIFAILNLDCEKGKLWVVLGKGLGNQSWLDGVTGKVEAAEAHAVHRTSRSFC